MNALVSYRRLLWVILLTLAINAGICQAQVIDSRAQTDTLKFVDRLSLRTNLVDWTLLAPSIGVEYDLIGTNWSRWAVGLGFRGNWQTTHTYNPGVVFNLMEVRADVRNYYRLRQRGDDRIPAYNGLLDRYMAWRNKPIKHPEIVYYRGLFATYSNFSVKLGDEGKQGSAFTFGVTWGGVKPLYAFKGGSTLDFEFGISVGMTYANYDTYGHDRVDNCYPVIEKGTWKIVPYPVVSEVRLGLVYRIGKYPSTRKYRWRYDADPAYADRLRTEANQRETDRINKRTADSIRSLVDKDFRRVYDDLAAKNKVAAAQQKALQREQEAAKREQERLAEQQEKERQRQEKEQQKAAEKAAKEAEKQAEKAAKDGAEAGSEGGVTTAAGVAAPTVSGDAPADGDNETATEAEKPADENAESSETPAEEAEQPAEEAQSVTSEQAEQPAESTEQPAESTEQPATESAEPTEAPAEEAAESSDATQDNDGQQPDQSETQPNEGEEGKEVGE